MVDFESMVETTLEEDSDLNLKFPTISVSKIKVPLLNRLGTVGNPSKLLEV